ncbi:MAG: FAD-dependent oxidoreductase [bacterium]
MTDKSNDYDVIIIGGGISGLFLGALLCKRNVKVLVCERQTVLGGRYRAKLINGVMADFGFKGNRFASQGYVQELFDLLDEPIEFINSPGIIIYENNKFSVLPRGLKPTLLHSGLSWRGKLTFIKLYRELLSSPPEGNYRTSLHQWLSERTERAEIFNLFRYYSQLGVVSPDLKETSLGEFISLAKKGLTARYSFGVPKGGWQKKLVRLTSIIESRGEIRTDCRVEKIVVKENKVRGVQCREGVLSAKAVVAAFPLNPGLFKIIEEKLFPGEWVENIKSLKPTTGINIDFCLNRKITAEDRLVVTHEPYPVTQGILESNLIPGIAPPDKLYGSWLLPVPFEKFSDRAYLDRQTGRLKELISEMFPGIWDCCEWQRIMRIRMVNAVAPRPDQNWEDRPAFAAPGFDNLFLAGDTTRGTGGGGDVTMSSVLQVYHLITSRFC